MALRVVIVGSSIARYMSGAHGRFTNSDDPFVDQYDSDPQSWNLYSYVRNNPFRFIDPTGRACVIGPDGSQHDDNSGGKSCTDFTKADKELGQSVTVSGSPRAISRDALGRVRGPLPEEIPA